MEAPPWNVMFWGGVFLFIPKYLTQRAQRYKDHKDGKRGYSSKIMCGLAFNALFMIYLF